MKESYVTFIQKKMKQRKKIAKEFKVNKNDVITLVDVDFAEYSIPHLTR